MPSNLPSHAVPLGIAPVTTVPADTVRARKRPRVICFVVPISPDILPRFVVDMSFRMQSAHRTGALEINDWLAE